MSAVTVTPIRTEADYRQALDEIEALMKKDIQPDSPEAARFQVLCHLAWAYKTIRKMMDSEAATETWIPWEVVKQHLAEIVKEDETTTPN